MSRLTITVKGAEELAAKLERGGDRAVNARPVLEDMFDMALDAEKSQFRTGKKWAPNTASTSASKRGSKVGIDSGSLMASLTIPNAPGQKKKVTDSYVVFGSALPHAHLFDQGRPGNQPARPLIQLRATDKKNMREAVLDFLVGDMD